MPDYNELNLLKVLKQSGVDSLLKFYCSCIRSLLEYVCQVFYSSLPDYLSHQIVRIQKRAFQLLFSESSDEEALEKAKCQPCTREQRHYVKHYSNI